MKRTAHNSILTKISTLITVLCFIIMAYSVYELYHRWTNYRHATELETVQDITRSFSDSLKNFMFERGRMNVILSKEEPVSDENSVFIDDRRTEADEAFKAGFAAMEKDFPVETENLRKEYEKINALRLKVDEEADKPLAERDISTRELWFNSCSDYIDTVITKINIVHQLSQNNSNISNCFDVVVDSLYFRNIVGIESSIITSSLAGNGIISDEDHAKLLCLMGKETQIWSDLEKTIIMLDSENLNIALDNVREKYYMQFQAEQERIVELAHKNQFTEGADKELANLSVPALDSVLHLSGEAVNQIETENQKSINREIRGFWVGIIQLIIGLLIVVLVPIYFRRRFVQPLTDIILTLKDIGEGKTDNQIPHTQRTDEIGKLAHGADMLKHSIAEEQLLKRELEKTVIKLEDLSVKDSLTQLYNRRYIAERFEELVKRYKRNGQVFSVVMCDIDNFKFFNDRYGHECGDKVLIHLSGQLSAYCRESDILARWGGEEFIFLLSDTNREGARALAERIRAGLESTKYECDLFELNLTMTFGVAEYFEAEDMHETINRADLALLRGKNSGRNKVVVSDKEKGDDFTNEQQGGMNREN